MRMLVYIRACVTVRMNIWVSVCFSCSTRSHSCDLNPVTEDADLIQSDVQCEPDTLAIQKSTHEIIWRSVPVRAVKTRRRFGPKTASFHVCLFFTLLLITVIFFFNYYYLQILFVYVRTVHDHAHLDDIYTRVVVFETGMYSIYCRLDVWS